NLEKATLVRASLAGARADKANFSRVEAYRGNFSAISAENASFASAELQRTDFTGARLTGADFEKAELGRANFDKAVLTGTRFSMANLSRAKLSGAVLEGPIDLDRAFLFLTRIEGVDLSSASGLTQEQVDLTCGDGATKLPSGLAAPGKWPCPPDDD
ncbi:pentapeptide repeat-containing protein, partial [Sinorhizobium meliloti]